MAVRNTEPAGPGTGTGGADVPGAVLAFLEAVPAGPARRGGPGIGVARALQRIGPPFEVAGPAERLVITGRRGSLRAWALVGDDGAVAALVLGRPRGRLATRLAPRPLAVRPVLLAALAALAAATVATAAAAAWRAGTRVGWAADAAWVLVAALATAAVVRLPPRWYRWLVTAIVAAAAASALRWPDMAPGAPDVATFVPATFLVVELLTAAALRRSPGGPSTAALSFPLPEGTWRVVAGGGPRPVNPHRGDAAQRAALHIVALDGRGRRARRWFPGDPGAFGCYGASVVAPCDGRVVRARDGIPDQQPYRRWPAPPVGNHVAIDNGTELVLLAHLRPGSVRVVPGDEVARGQEIGEVGCSGDATEPYLHIHAERAGTAVALRFTGVPRPRRGVTVSRQRIGWVSPSAGREPTGT